MKKTFFFLLTLMLCVGMLAGCSQNGENKSEKITVYSFCGENEQFACDVIVDLGTALYHDKWRNKNHHAQQRR